MDLGREIRVIEVDPLKTPVEVEPVEIEEPVMEEIDGYPERI
ncbi:MAG TPA: hypothetical protein VFO17_08435 [Acidimicrobiia bacterium]|jgi:hypothetical protein|nr:hypothetical protein [Acidimicrobiia bacterium]